MAQKALTTLPIEILYLIFEHLEHIKDRCALSQTQRRMYSTGISVVLRHSSPLSQNKALWWAAQNGVVAVARMAIMYGAEADKVNNLGESPLYTASKRGYTDVVRLLLDSSEIDSRDSPDGSSALAVAVRNGRDSVVDVLLAAGANVDSKDRYGETCLHVARGKQMLCKILPESRYVNQQCVERKTPLHRALEAGDVEVAKMLLDYGADPRIADLYGRNALVVARELEMDKMSETAGVCRHISTMCNI